MAVDELLKPTLHVEVLVQAAGVSHVISKEICEDVAERLVDNYDTVEVGQEVYGFDNTKHGKLLGRIEVVDFTGPEKPIGYYNLKDVQLDTKAYVLKGESNADRRRNIKQQSEDEMPQARVLALPNVALKDEWNSLVFDDALPARLLRYMVRMVNMMNQTDLNLSTFNWNRLCLLHGPPGSGKSTLCRALAQKLSIRLGDEFAQSILVEISSNAMLSKYFGESGRLIGATFENIYKMAEDPGTFICVVMDEVETIAGSRDRSTSGMECNDGLRATNQLLTALDRLRNLPNVIVLCTSNLIAAIDPAFLDRVDIKQLIPSPSPAAIYNIFRSCLNELMRSNLVDSAAMQVSSGTLPLSATFSSKASSSLSAKRGTRSSKSKAKATTQACSSSPEPWTIVTPPTIPTFSAMKVLSDKHPSSPANRVWNTAQKCEGFSGRILRRLPILALAMYTWGGNCSINDALSALEAAVDEELIASKGGKGDVQMAGA